MHNGPFNEPASLGIPGLNFQAEVTKFGRNVELNMLINISSRFYQNCQKKKKKMANYFFRIFQLHASHR